MTKSECLFNVLKGHSDLIFYSDTFCDLIPNRFLEFSLDFLLYIERISVRLFAGIADYVRKKQTKTSENILPQIASKHPTTLPACADTCLCLFNMLHRSVGIIVQLVYTDAAAAYGTAMAV